MAERYSQDYRGRTGYPERDRQGQRDSRDRRDRNAMHPRSRPYNAPNPAANPYQQFVATGANSIGLNGEDGGYLRPNSLDDMTGSSKGKGKGAKAWVTPELLSWLDKRKVDRENAPFDAEWLWDREPGPDPWLEKFLKHGGCSKKGAAVAGATVGALNRAGDDDELLNMMSDKEGDSDSLSKSSSVSRKKKKKKKKGKKIKGVKKKKKKRKTTRLRPAEEWREVSGKSLSIYDKVSKNENDSDDDSEDNVETGPLPNAMELQLRGGAIGSDFGRYMRPGEASAMAAYAEKDIRIPRRGEVGMSAEQIEFLETQGYVMSGSRHRRMNAVRLRKENQIYSAEEQRALALFNFEERQKKEQALIGSMREMLVKKQEEIEGEREVLRKFETGGIAGAGGDEPAPSSERTRDES